MSRIVILAILIAFFLFVYSSFLEEPEEADSEELEKQIGQMIMVGFRGTEVTEDSGIVKAIEDIGIGGVVLFDFDIPSNSFPRNIISPEQTKGLIYYLQSYSSIPLFIAVDVEGGRVNRLKPEYGFSEILSAQELGKKDYESTEKEALKISQELKELGFNMNFAPVVDVNINPENPIIGGLGRSFSSDSQEVFLHAKAFIKAHRKNNIIPVVKHFPGHGSSLKDSHLGMVDVTETYKEEEIIPYKKLQEDGALEAVMTAHIFNRNVDEEYPATLSSIFLKDILRKELGFQGIIISDDMQMKAIVDSYGFEESIIRAINSGCDILLFSNNSQTGYDDDLPYKVHQVIYEAVKDGRISKERINESYDRVISLKDF